MRIVFLHRANDPYTIERIRYFLKNHHEVHSISFSSFNYKADYQTDIENVNVVRLKKTMIDKIPLAKRVSHHFELEKILKQIKPDILHVVSALNLFYCDTKFSKVKVIENQGSDVIVSPKKFKFLKYYYKHYYKKVDGIIQDSKLAFENGLKYGAFSDTNLNKIIEIGIDFKIFNNSVQKGVARKKYNLGNRKIIFHTRGLVESYNVDIILQSILQVRKVFPDCVYLLTTTFEKLNPQMQNIIESNKLANNILFVGYQDRIESLKYLYRDADVHISVPSSDSSPFSVYESMACMTPNVVTDLPWLYSNFTPGKHLVTCPVRDAEKLGNTIVDVLHGKHNIDMVSAYNIVYNNINFEKENAKLEEFYKYLLKKNGND